LGRLPGKFVTILLLVAGFGGLFAWLATPLIFRDKTPILSDFLFLLEERSKDLDPGVRLPVPVPPLNDGEQVVLAMGPGATTLGKDVDLSSRARTAIERDLSADRPDLTFVYLVSKGEIRGRIEVSRCNLMIAGTAPFIVTKASRPSAAIECVPVTGPERPEQCRNIIGLWNERCAARLVAQ
jgi:hypothetical protein